MPAGAEPLVFFAGRPAAERAADARGFRSAGLLIFLKLAVWNNDRVVRHRSHACHYDLIRFLWSGKGRRAGDVQMGGDGRTREARIKAGRSRKTKARKA